MDSAQSKLEDLFGVDEMSEDQKEEFMEKVGSIVMESSVLRLLATLSPNQIAVLEGKVTDDVPAEDLLSYLLKNFPEFETILVEEVEAFKKEAEEIMGES